jgi:zona occludens toxin
MITLITGSTGAGKTAKMVFEMKAITDRPFFVMGIPELKLDHQPVPPVAEWTRLVPHPDDPSLRVPEFTFPPNAIVVIDEAQHVYRPRPAGSKVPDIVAAFETHRHLGIDFWLLTQAPGLLDQNIRRLVKKHWHIHESPLGKKLLEWSQCRDPESKTDRADAIASAFKPPKSVFALYKSAEVHTKLHRKLPMALFVVIAMVLIFAGMSYYLVGRVKSKLQPVPTPEQQLQGDKTKPIGKPVEKAIATAPSLEENPLQYVVNFSPRHQDFPESAPAYDAIRSIKSYPVVAGCLKMAEKCRCYSQQGSRIEMSLQRCLDILHNKVFDPYRENPPVIVASAAESRHRPLGEGVGTVRSQAGEGGQQRAESTSFRSVNPQ